MPIVKPTDFGNSYWCYKHFCAIIVLGCVDASMDSINREGYGLETVTSQHDSSIEFILRNRLTIRVMFFYYAWPRVVGLY